MLIITEEVKTEEQKKEYIDFIYDLYADDANFSDVNLILVKKFLYQQDSFTKRNICIPIIVRKDGEINFVGIYVIDETEEIKLSFPEFTQDCLDVLNAVRDYSLKLKNRYNKKKIVIGINGQISYGLGVLSSKYSNKFEFNSNYNKPYYAEDLLKISDRHTKAFSYKYNGQNTLNKIDKNLLKEIEKNYTFRFFNPSHFKEDMLIFGELCDKTLKSTPYYSLKTPEEMYELMKEVKPFFRAKDIIFAEHNNQPVGYIYAHPDYAELFDKPRLNRLKFYLRFLLKKPKNFIYNVIGVLPEHQKSGLAIALICKSIELNKDQYPNSVSSFILEDNIPSTSISRHFSTGINKEFYLFEIGDK